MSDCPFCNPSRDGVRVETELVCVIRDGFPISDGHTLIVPRRHVASFFDLEPDEQAAMLSALTEAKHALDAELAPDGYNIGINDGPVAGQTVAHCHIHLIPRYDGDVEDPRGGVRWVIPAKAEYWGD